MSTGSRTNLKHLIPLAVLCLTAGCTTTNPDQTAAQSGPAEKIEYEWVTPLGSRVPVRVKKVRSPNANAVDELRTVQDLAKTGRLPAGSN